MNVDALIVEQLHWDGSLKTVDFRPEVGAALWIADLDEYGESRSGPYHFLDPRQEKRFARQRRRQRARRVTGLERDSTGVYRFRTTWRGIPTSRGGRSSYALTLPPGAAPIITAFKDPRSSRTFGHELVFDPQHRCVVAYLECRSRFGSFDFDLDIRFRDDPAAAEALPRSTFQGEINAPNLGSEERQAIQQFFAGSTAILAESGATVVKDITAGGSVVAGVSGTVGAVGDHNDVLIESPPAALIEAMQAQTDRLRHEIDALVQVLAEHNQALLAEAQAAADAVAHNDARTAAVALRRLGRAGLAAARDLGLDLLAALIAAQIGSGP